MLKHYLYHNFHLFEEKKKDYLNTLGRIGEAENCFGGYYSKITKCIRPVWYKCCHWGVQAWWFHPPGIQVQSAGETGQGNHRGPPPCRTPPATSKECFRSFVIFGADKQTVLGPLGRCVNSVSAGHEILPSCNTQVLKAFTFHLLGWLFLVSLHVLCICNPHDAFSFFSRGKVKAVSFFLPMDMSSYAENQGSLKSPQNQSTKQLTTITEKDMWAGEFLKARWILR